MPGIIFDIDNTLVNSDLAYDVALRSIGLSLSDPKYLDARANVKKRLGAGNVNARNRLSYFKNLLENEKKYSAVKLLEMMDHYETALAKEFARQWTELKRAAFFEKISARYPIVLLTNENLRTQLIKLNAMDPQGRFFSRLITSEEVGVEKPNHKMFQLALESLSFSAKDCLVVGDDLESDIKPALALGFQCIHTREFLLPSVVPKTPENVPIISKLDELERFLA